DASRVRNEGCGRFRWKVTSKSPSAVTVSRLSYQDLRGLMRSRSLPLPAVMPLDAAAQRHCQLGALFIPAPPCRQIRDDRLRAVLRHLLVEHHQIVEDPHHWAVYGERRFLEHRHAGRAVKMTRVQDAALLLSGGWGSRGFR